MEGSSSTSHFRSVSLPSRLTHPSCTKIETKINDLKALGNLVVSTQTIQKGLVELAELYVCVDELLRTPQTQQALSRHQNGTPIEDALEGSIGLLDSCSNLRDLFVLMKERVQILQSVLRRKGGDSTVASQIETYLCFRKKANKSVIKSLKALKHLEKKMGTSFLFLDVDHHGLMVTKVVRETNTLTISLFKSLLVLLSLKTKTKPNSGVQLILKLVSRSTPTHDENMMFVSEAEAMDLALIKTLHKNSRARHDEINILDVQMTLKKLKILDLSLQGFETGLDHLFRRLVQSRASLLNIELC